MKVIGLGKDNIEDGQIYEVSTQVGEILIGKGLAYLEGTEKPKPAKKKK